MTTTTVETITRQLTEMGICQTDRAQRREMAVRLQSDKRFTPAVLDRLWEVADGSDHPPSLVASWLRNGDKWFEVFEDASAVRRAPPKKRPERVANQRTSISSALDHADSDNPHGWNPTVASQMRVEDHNTPGVWNPYRQTYNLKELGPDGTHRVRGCTRWEVIGMIDDAKAEWSSSQVNDRFDRKDELPETAQTPNPKAKTAQRAANVAMSEDDDQRRKKWLWQKKLRGMATSAECEELDGWEPPDADQWKGIL